MLWDSIDVQPVQITSDKRAVALALTACDRLADKLRHSLELACFDVIALADVARLIVEISIRKPDIVLLDERLAENVTEMKARLQEARRTETLPMLSIRPDTFDTGCPMSFSTRSNGTEIFLKTRALLRRERPGALRGQRQNGAFLLDESRFKLLLGEKFVDLSKTELCLLGPFFDVEDAVLDRQSLERLVFGEHKRKLDSRIVDFQISRMRRRVKTRLDVDPLRSVRGIGYALTRF